MLPFLKPKHVATGIIVTHRSPDHLKEQPIDSELEAICEDLIQAMHAKDAKGMAQAFQAAVDCCSGDESEDFGYDAMNEKAAKDPGEEF